LWHRYLQRVLELSWSDRMLLAEAMAGLGIARLAIVVLPFRRIAPYLGHQQCESPVMDALAPPASIRRIAQAVGRVSRHTPWSNTCLVQAIAAKMMLQRRGVPSTLYLGVMKPEATRFAAHAWLRSGSVILTGALGRERFTVISTFAEEEGPHPRA
jgi:hypothetical protein